MRIAIILALIVCAIRPVLQAQPWQILPHFPGIERDDGVAFVCGGKAYCGTGVTTGGQVFGDFFSLNMSNDLWSQISPLPVGEERQYASAFSDGISGFIFGGTSSGSYLSDLWKYDVQGNSWTSMTPIPAPGRGGICSFVLEDTAYIIGGRNDSSTALSEVWAYCLPLDSWERKGDLPFGGRWRASASALNGKGYLTFGANELDCFCTEMYEYEAASDTWTQISNFPGNGRRYASMQTISAYLVAFAGQDSFDIMHNDLWSFDPGSLKWRQLVSLPAIGRRGGISFTNGHDLYYTTGLDQNYKRLRESWMNSHVTGLDESPSPGELNIYPNPCSNFIFIRRMASGTCDFILTDTRGRDLMSGKLELQEEKIDLKGVDAGVYFLRLIEMKSVTVHTIMVR